MRFGRHHLAPVARHVRRRITRIIPRTAVETTHGFCWLFLGISLPLHRFMVAILFRGIKIASGKSIVVLSVLPQCFDIHAVRAVLAFLSELLIAFGELERQPLETDVAGAAGFVILLAGRRDRPLCDATVKSSPHISTRCGNIVRSSDSQGGEYGHLRHLLEASPASSWSMQITRFRQAVKARRRQGRTKSITQIGRRHQRRSAYRCHG